MADSDPAAQSRTARRVARTEKSLVEAARDVLLACGLSAATIEEITNRADVGKGTFYIYFSSKTAIFESLVCGTLRRLMAGIRAFERDATDLRSALERLVQAELEFYQRSSDDFRLVALARTLLQLNEVELPESAEMLADILEVFETLVKQQAEKNL